MKRDFVVSCYVFSPQGKTLLIHHRKLGVWLPPGGHIEENELPHEAALRETKEETGFSVSLISSDPIWVEEENAQSLPRPILCLLEHIPKWGTIDAHQHIDMIYVARTHVSSVENPEGQQGVERWKWFSLDEVEALVNGKDVFREVKQIVKYLFYTYSSVIVSETP